MGIDSDHLDTDSVRVYDCLRKDFVVIFFFFVEINGLEEGVCGYNPEHGERGGSQDYGVGEENA